MKLILLVVGLIQAHASVLDVFAFTNGHEPRVALNCGHVPFYIDLKTGSWVEDSEGLELCDEHKENVKKYCQKMYPKLNITNIVEANTPQTFNNWCQSGQTQCTEAKEVIPYRCLVNEYEADALMVPDGCKFDHIHDPSQCLSHDQWKEKASQKCDSQYKMKLRDYGILLSCGTDLFTGVEFVCCPEKMPETKQATTEAPKMSKDVFQAAIAKFLRYLPSVSKGCDRSTYLTKQASMGERHQSQIAAVVDEWDMAEKRYNDLKKKDPVVAEEKMKRTLEVFRQTLAALEQESKDEKERLRIEHADCINTQISKDKRDAMINYLAAIQKEPANADEILGAVRKFIQVCEHDRVHSLRHFEHVRRRNASKADAIRSELLQHLKGLNKVVNESMALLNYLPTIAQKFGLTGNTAVLKPKTELPEAKHEDHVHERVKEILEKHKHLEEDDEDDDDDDDDDEESIFVTSKPIPLKKLLAAAKINNAVETPEPTKEIREEENQYKSTKSLGKIAAKIKNEYDDSDDEDDIIVDSFPVEDKKKHHARSPMVINIILGLCCGILVVMLIVVIVMVIQRRRVAHTRVVIAENNDDREHLIQMQKNGFENPTYKFFYY